MASDTMTAAAAFIVIHQIINKKKKKSPRWWMKQLYKNRNSYGTHLHHQITFENQAHEKVNFHRMSSTDFEYLFGLIAPTIQKEETRFQKPISAKERFMITLRFLATGDSYTTLQYMFKVSKQSISAIVPEVCDTIVDALIEYIKVPASAEEWLKISAEFEEKWNFPHCIGAMDGKHVILQAPINSSSEYFNYKNHFSIVMFAVVDANYNFLYVDVGCQGRISDDGVFKNTKLYEKLEQKSLHLPDPDILLIPYQTEVLYVLVADKAFSLNEYTMKPFQTTPSRGSIERIFNYRLSRARRVVENAFGILSAVFRVFRNPMLLEPTTATKIVLATVYLHNFLRRHSIDVYTPPGSIDSEVNGQINPGRWREETRDITLLLQVRNVPLRARQSAEERRWHLARHFTTNAALPWQNNS